MSQQNSLRRSSGKKLSNGSEHQFLISVAGEISMEQWSCENISTVDFAFSIANFISFSEEYLVSMVLPSYFFHFSVVKSS